LGALLGFQRQALPLQRRVGGLAYGKRQGGETKKRDKRPTGMIAFHSLPQQRRHIIAARF
jgi:hypothetical protein